MEKELDRTLEAFKQMEVEQKMQQAIDKKPQFNVEENTPGHLMGNISLMNDLLVKPSIKFSEGIKTPKVSGNKTLLIG